MGEDHRFEIGDTLNRLSHLVEIGSLSEFERKAGHVGTVGLGDFSKSLAVVPCVSLVPSPKELVRLLSHGFVGVYEHESLSLRESRPVWAGEGLCGWLALSNLVA